MKGLTITKQITLDRSAEQWELYTTSPGRALDCELAAQAINKAIEDAFNRGETQREVEKIALETMGKYSDLGAMDSEPQCILIDLLLELFPRKTRFGSV